MAAPGNAFMVRGKLIGPPEVKTVGRSNMNITEFVLQYDEEYNGKQGPGVREHFIPVSASQYDIDPNILTQMQVGSTVVVTGILEGRRYEKNGNVGYFPTIKAKVVVSGTSEELPF